ncbi:MAG: tetratricopeptide repeat protein [Gemmatimonadaceae bacterium]|nr:tetratricopeptide repeat protein [Gemmatimonadaceae bacterium]
MSWWSRLTGGGTKSGAKAQRVDYLGEALALERQGDFDAALTSYRLALRDQPNNYRALQNMAIAFSKTGQMEEAIRAYKRALEIQPTLSGSHYGLAFLLLKRGSITDGAYHLEAFLMDPPTGPDAERWIEHARATLDKLNATGGHAAGGNEHDGVPPADAGE